MQKALCDATFKRSPEVHKYQQPASRSGRTLTAKERYIPPARVPYVAESHIGTYPLIGRPWGGKLQNDAASPPATVCCCQRSAGSALRKKKGALSSGALLTFCWIFQRCLFSGHQLLLSAIVCWYRRPRSVKHGTLWMIGQDWMWGAVKQPFTHWCVWYTSFQSSLCRSETGCIGVGFISFLWCILLFPRKSLSQSSTPQGFLFPSAGEFLMACPFPSSQRK